MDDAVKLRMAVVLVASLCVLSFAYNVTSEYILPDIEGYLKRRLYYETVISKKGLSMHRTTYWSVEGARDNGLGGKRTD